MPIETRVHDVSGTVSQTAADLGAEAVAVPVRTGPVTAAEVAAQLPFTLDELLALHKAKGEPGRSPRPRSASATGSGNCCCTGWARRPRPTCAGPGALARRGRGRTALVAGCPGRRPRRVHRGALLASYEFKIGAPQRRRSAPSPC